MLIDLDRRDSWALLTSKTMKDLARMIEWGWHSTLKIACIGYMREVFSGCMNSYLLDDDNILYFSLHEGPCVARALLRSVLREVKNKGCGSHPIRNFA